METTATPATQESESFGARIRHLAIGALFAVVLLVPKLLRLRRDERSWTAFRILLGLAGAALVILPLAFWNSWLAGLAGLAMFLISILLPPGAPLTSTDEKTRELHALVVVNGGNYQPRNAAAAPVRLFAGTDNIWALDSHLRPLLTIPCAEISSVRVEGIEGHWVLRLRWMDRAAEFSFQGIFAEHFARVAESTIRSVIPSSLPILPRSRAAGA
jgi:hypothetical protein